MKKLSAAWNTVGGVSCVRVGFGIVSGGRDVLGVVDGSRLKWCVALGLVVGGAIGLVSFWWECIGGGLSLVDVA
eukprot:6972175-Alexandrium_andersonii.AAC.1